jgi:hypothetical protein
MTDLLEPLKKVKKIYASPMLFRHGDVRSLTRSGAGSAKEPVNSGNGSPQKKP